MLKYSNNTVQGDECEPEKKKGALQVLKAAFKEAVGLRRHPHGSLIGSLLNQESGKTEKNGKRQGYGTNSW